MVIPGGMVTESVDGIVVGGTTPSQVAASFQFMLHHLGYIRRLVDYLLWYHL